MTNKHGPKGIQQAGNLLDHCFNLAYNSSGEKIVRYKEKEFKIPYKIKQQKALIAIWSLLLYQKQLGLDSELDPKHKAEAYKALRSKYNQLSVYIQPDDIVLINMMFRDGV
jgi:hypothetical protein